MCLWHLIGDESLVFSHALGKWHYPGHVRQRYDDNLAGQCAGGGEGWLIFSVAVLQWYVSWNLYTMGSFNRMTPFNAEVRSRIPPKLMAFLGWALLFCLWVRKPHDCPRGCHWRDRSPGRSWELVGISWVFLTCHQWPARGIRAYISLALSLALSSPPQQMACYVLQRCEQQNYVFLCYRVEFFKNIYPRKNLWEYKTHKSSLTARRNGTQSNGALKWASIISSVLREMSECSGLQKSAFLFLSSWLLFGPGE